MRYTFFSSDTTLQLLLLFVSLQRSDTGEVSNTISGQRGARPESGIGIKHF